MATFYNNPDYLYDLFILVILNNKSRMGCQADVTATNSAPFAWIKAWVSNNKLYAKQVVDNLSSFTYSPGPINAVCCNES